MPGGRSRLAHSGARAFGELSGFYFGWAVLVPAGGLLDGMAGAQDQRRLHATAAGPPASGLQEPDAGMPIASLVERSRPLYRLRLGDWALIAGWRSWLRAGPNSLASFTVDTVDPSGMFGISAVSPGKDGRAMSSNNDYVPPKVWTWEKPGAAGEWRYSGVNRPIAGATHDAELPVGKHPLQLYSRATPNGVKVTVMLEELLALGHSGAEYDAWLIDIGKGEQFGSGFVDMNPNSKIPALLDRSGAKPRRVFESGSILLYLAEKFGAFLPSDPDKRTETLNWLFWQMGSTPYIGGGFGHFY